MTAWHFPSHGRVAQERPKPWWTRVLCRWCEVGEDVVTNDVELRAEQVESVQISTVIRMRDGSTYTVETPELIPRSTFQGDPLVTLSLRHQQERSSYSICKPIVTPEQWLTWSFGDLVAQPGTDCRLYTVTVTKPDLEMPQLWDGDQG